MRDRVNPSLRPASEGFESLHAPRLSPAEGLESAASLFTAPPIESLELLRELGEIAAASIRETQDFLGLAELETSLPVAEMAVIPSTPADLPLVHVPPNSDARLLEALLEYHRLRGPKLGARTAPRPSSETKFARADASTDSTERFASAEIPVIQDAVPKTSPNGIRASRPVQTILKPKPRP